MKFLYSFLLILIASPFAAAESHQANAVLSGMVSPDESLMLVGRGIKNRKNDESLALACAGDFDLNTHSRKCDRLQWVWYRGSQDVTWVGSPILMFSSSENPENSEYSNELKQELLKITAVAKGIIKNDFLKKREANRHDSTKETFRILTGFFISSGLAMAYIVNQPGAATDRAFWIFLGTGLLTVKLADILTIPSGSIVPTPFYDGLSPVSNKDGWSWAQRPKKVSPRTFNGLLHAIQESMIR